MKKIIILCLVFLITGCNFVLTGSNPEAVLTLYYTRTAVAVESPIPESTIEPAAITPQPTSTQRIHVVALNDTISSISLKYGLTIDAILLANPDIEPNAMIVGDQVIIPGVSKSTLSESDPALTANLVFRELNCLPTGGGLWCGVWLKNNAAVDYAFPVAAFTFIDGDGAVLKTTNVPAELRWLPSGGEVPITFFMDSIPKNYRSIQTSVYSAEILPPETIVERVIVESSSVTLSDLSGRITGRMRVESSGGGEQSDITIAAAAVDAEGQLIGVRRKDSRAAVDESFEFGITVYAAGGLMADIVLFTEVYENGK